MMTLPAQFTNTSRSRIPSASVAPRRSTRSFQVASQPAGSAKLASLSENRLALPRRLRYTCPLQSSVFVESRESSAATATSVRLESTSSQDNELTVKGILDVTATPDLIYNLLVAYDKGAEVYRDVVESKLIQDDGERKIVCQVCQWRFLAFSGTFTTQLSVTETPEKFYVTFTLLDSALLKSFRGSWKVVPKTAEHSEVQYTLTVEPHMVMPAPIKAAVSAAFSRQAELLLLDLSAAILKLSQPPVDN